MQLKDGSTFQEEDSDVQHITTAIGYMIDFEYGVARGTATQNQTCRDLKNGCGTLNMKITNKLQDEWEKCRDANGGSEGNSRGWAQISSLRYLGKQTKNMTPTRCRQHSTKQRGARLTD